MEEMKCFIIEGSKKLIFRREEMIYICFDPDALEFYEINESGACILFLISKELMYVQIVEILQDWFEIEKREAEEYIKGFMEIFPMKHIIMSNLIKIGVPQECLLK